MTTPDLDQLEARVAGAAACEVVELRPLEGGHSSETFLVVLARTTTPSTVVLKVAPTGVAPVGNRDVLRQARILRALSDAPGVRVPLVQFEDLGEPPTTPPFFAMSWVDGDSVEPDLDDASMVPAPEEVASRARSAARQLAALHLVDRGAVGLGDEPALGLLDEVDRWDKAFATVPVDLRNDDVVACSTALRRSVPDARPPALLHGDFRLGNALCHDGEVRAIIDWEIWSVGDARLDLAWFLMVADPVLHPSLVRSAPGMPTPDELHAEYVAAGGIEAPALDWFRALVLYKLAATTALIVKGARRRGSPPEQVAPTAAFVPVMVERAVGLLIMSGAMTTP